jgi:MSHA biogenesis protein MshM
LQHRIKSAGYRGPELFDNGAQCQLYKFSQGIPRVINVLSNKALMLSYASGEYYVNSKHIDAAAADSQLQ